jgi:hypothetical protein
MYSEQGNYKHVEPRTGLLTHATALRASHAASPAETPARKVTQTQTNHSPVDLQNSINSLWATLNENEAAKENLVKVKN